MILLVPFFMRILWLSHRDTENPRSGGAEKTILEVGRRLVERGHNLHWVSSRWSGAAKSQSLSGIQILRFNGSLLPHLIAPSLLHGPTKPEVVVDDLAHVLPWGSPWCGSVPTVAFFHHLHRRTLGGQVSPGWSLILSSLEHSYKLIYSQSRLVTESEQAVRDLEELGLPIDHVRRIPPGVDLQFFSPGERTPAPYIVYFGGLRHYKRPEHALRAFARLRTLSIPAKLVILGAGPCVTHLRAEIIRLRLADWVMMPGKVSEIELRSILRGAWVNVHCSVAEGWGQSTMEAAACGVPTVAYDVPGIHESVKSGRSGILVKDGDTDALSEAMKKIIEGSLEWRNQSRKRAESFSWDTTTSGWEAVLSEASQV